MPTSCPRMEYNKSMTATIGFVACSKTKSSQRLPAGAIYTSPLFRKSLLAAIDRCDKVYILSAKHGVIDRNEPIEPYDLTLKRMKQAERAAWGEKTGLQLKGLLNRGDRAVMYCGQDYLTPLRSTLADLEVGLEKPLGDLSLGSRLSLLKKLNGEAGLNAMAKPFFSLMREVWQFQEKGRCIGETNGRQDWPKRGVYFILSANSALQRGFPRIIRVGTHAVSQGSQTTLWNRLSTHRGTEAGLGSHRSSIFRLHVGRAWAKCAIDEDWPDSWAQGQTAPANVRKGEELLERRVSELIGAMRVIWLNVCDEPSAESERAYLERNSIGLLSRLGLLGGVGEADWLGHFSSDWRIASSGLWNLNHIFRRPDPDFIDRLAIAVDRTIGNPSRNEDHRDHSHKIHKQLRLLKAEDSK